MQVGQAWGSPELGVLQGRGRGAPGWAGSPLAPSRVRGRVRGRGRGLAWGLVQEPALLPGAESRQRACPVALVLGQHPRLGCPAKQWVEPCLLHLVHQPVASVGNPATSAGVW